MKDLGKAAGSIAIVAIGVIAAGFIMNQLRDSIGFFQSASNGFDT